MTLTERIRAALPLADEFQRDGHQLRRLGSQFVSLCPFHQERTPSCHVNPSTGRFRCFGCGAAGTVIDYNALKRAITPAAAITELAMRIRDFGPMWSPDNNGNQPTVTKLREGPANARRFRKLPLMYKGSSAELAELAELRRLSVEAVQLASTRGLLRFCRLNEGTEAVTAWVITDRTRRNAQARRLDGARWQYAWDTDAQQWLPIQPDRRRKVRGFTGNQASWPVGLEEAQPVFDSDSLTHLQVLSRTPIAYGQLNEVGDGVTWVPCSEESATLWRWEQPKVGCAYLIVADLAEGEDQTKGEDPDRHSVLVLRKAYQDQDQIQHRLRVVARIRPPNRMPIYALVDLVWLLHLYYGRCSVIPEMNNSGAAFILGARAKGIPIWQRQEIDPHSGKKRGYDGWRTTDTREYGGLRSAIIWRLHEVLRNKELDCHCPHILSELGDFVDKGGRMEAASGHDDDCIALAIGVFNIESATTFYEQIRVIRLPPDLAALEREEEAIARMGMAMRW